MPEPRIRPLALCVFHHAGKILVNVFEDAVTRQTLYRPLGGGIEFGETGSAAIAREIDEELGQAINDVRLLGTLESLFVHDGKPGHEIVLVFDANFADTALYAQPWLDGHESDGARFRATWCDSSSFSADTPLVPKGLAELLKGLSLLD